MTRFILLIAVLAAAGGAGFFAMSPERSYPRSPYGDRPGELLEDFRFRDIEGERGRLADMLDEGGAVVIIMRDVDCPVAKRYGPELARLEREYGERGVRFLYLNANPQTDEAAAREEMERYGLTGRYVRDPEGRLAGRLGARTTTEVFVVDAAMTLRYRGAIDDQYGITFTKPEPRNRWLREALDGVLAGRGLAVSSTAPEGCYLELDAPSLEARPVTYHSRISRIIQDNCQTCHRAGGVAPFGLETYEQVSAYRGMVRYMAGNRLMPPWFADPAHGEFRNDRRLDDRDLAHLNAWIEAGAPEGDPDDGPMPRTWADGWILGEPDAVIPMPESFDVPAEGTVPYQYMWVKTDFPEDRWIRSLEIRPGARAVVHHVLVFIEEPGRPWPDEAKEGEPVAQGGINGFFAGYAPGFSGFVYPDGSAKRLPAGAWLKFQIHYTANGTAITDRSELGLFFADAPPEREVRTWSVWDAEFVIPPGASRHEVVAQRRFREPGVLLSLTPHMHNRGAGFRYELERPDGTREVLLDVPRYDFNWQLTYELAEPVPVAAGDVMHGTAWFDNSANNPGNPDPTAEVRFGEQTWEEMMIGYFDWIPDRPLSLGED